jgi:hypothetical protein
MGRGLDGVFSCGAPTAPCAVFKVRRGRSRRFSVAMARGKHLFPFRTEKLSLSAPMVLGLQGPGRVGRRRFNLAPAAAGAFCLPDFGRFHNRRRPPGPGGEAPRRGQRGQRRRAAAGQRAAEPRKPSRRGHFALGTFSTGLRHGTSRDATAPARQRGPRRRRRWCGCSGAGGGAVASSTTSSTRSSAARQRPPDPPVGSSKNMCSQATNGPGQTAAGAPPSATPGRNSPL